MVKLVNLSLVMSSLLGCGSNQSNGVVEDSGPDVASTAVDGGACTWPSAFTSTGAEQASGPIAVGCWAHSTSGPASGGISSCSSAEYSLDCVGELTSNAPIPAPSSSLGCRVLLLPTPSNQSYYCCPCGQVGDVNPLESGVSPDAALAPGDSAPVVSDGAGAGDAGACYPLFHACTNNDDCCAPNRCLNITGTPECQQESPQLGGPEVGPEIPNTAVDAGACVWPASVTSTGDASTGRLLGPSDLQYLRGAQWQLGQRTERYDYRSRREARDQRLSRRMFSIRICLDLHQRYATALDNPRARFLARLHGDPCAHGERCLVLLLPLRSRPISAATRAPLMTAPGWA